MDRRNRKRLTKLIFAILARNPFEYGLVPDVQGWVKVKDLHWALMQAGEFRSLSVKGLQQFFDLYRPDRMEICGKHVRVLPEFHAPDLLYFPQASPPQVLYMAVRPKAHAHVLKRGMRPAGEMKWILLCPEREQALTLGRRRDSEPLVAVIRTGIALSHGAVFRRAGEILYLTQWIDPAWLELPPLPESMEKSGNGKKNVKSDVKDENESDRSKKMPGSFIPEFPSQWPEWYGEREGKRARRWPGKKKKKKHSGPVRKI